MHASGFAVASAHADVNKVYGQLDAVTPHSIGRGVANAASSEQDVLDASAPASAVTLTSGTTLSATSRTGVIVLPSGVGQPLSTTYAFDSQYSAAVPASNMKAPRFVDTLGNVVGHAQSGLGFHTVTTPYIQNMATTPQIAGVSSDVAACVNVWPARQEPTSATPPNFPPYNIHSITTSSLIPQQLTILGPSDTMSTHVVPSHIATPTQQQQPLTMLQQLPPIPTHTPFVAHAVTSTSAVASALAPHTAAQASVLTTTNTTPAPIPMQTVVAQPTSNIVFRQAEPLKPYNGTGSVKQLRNTSCVCHSVMGGTLRQNRPATCW